MVSVCLIRVWRGTKKRFMCRTRKLCNRYPITVYNIILYIIYNMRMCIMHIFNFDIFYTYYYIHIFVFIDIYILEINQFDSTQVYYVYTG